MLEETIFLRMKTLADLLLSGPIAKENITTVLHSYQINALLYKEMTGREVKYEEFSLPNQPKTL